jgi:hypothetical protein
MMRELRRIQRRHIARLRELQVAATELSAAGSRAALGQFAEMFVLPERAADFLLAIEAARAAMRELEYGRWLRQDAPPVEHRPHLGWLSRGRPGAACIRLDRRVVFPALHLPLDRMLDEWALSWPGAYVSFETRRAIVVSLDYELTCCDLSALGQSPYR